MNLQDIDHLTERFYQGVSFNKEHFPNFDQVGELFYGSGSLINNSSNPPVEFTVQTFAHSIMSQIEAGDASFFAQQEIADRTEIFGNMAQRISVFEYSFVKDTPNWQRGVNYIQYICFDSKWLITSMIWTFEKEGLLIPDTYLV
jgi:hypothetical protein